MKDKNCEKWYLKNREKELERMKQWRINNKERVKTYRKQYHDKNRDNINNHKKEYRKNNIELIKEQRKKDSKKRWQKIKNSERNKIKRREQHKKYYQKNKVKILAYGKIYSKLPHVRQRTNELARIRNRANPRSNRRGSIDLQLAMNNVRKRDHNTCQWQGCGLNFRQSPIHVHHIFPRSEYPDFELVEQYMICYCANHHGLWHRMRGDKYSEMIPARYQEDGIKSLELIY